MGPPLTTHGASTSTTHRGPLLRGGGQRVRARLRSQIEKNIQREKIPSVIPSVCVCVCVRRVGRVRNLTPHTNRAYCTRKFIELAGYWGSLHRAPRATRAPPPQSLHLRASRGAACLMLHSSAHTFTTARGTVHQVLTLYAPDYLLPSAPPYLRVKPRAEDGVIIRGV